MPARFEPAYDDGDDAFATPTENQCGNLAENLGLTLAVRATIRPALGLPAFHFLQSNGKVFPVFFSILPRN
jgi:hypothetical protein